MATISAARPTETVEFGDYVHVLRRRWRWLLVGALVGALLAVAYVQLTTPVYTAEAQVLVIPQAPSGSSSARPDQLVSMPTEVQIAGSGAVAQIARQDLGNARPVGALLDSLSVSSDPDSLVLTFSYTAATPAAAASGANAFADAYLAYKNEQASNAAATDLQRLQERLVSLQSARQHALEFEDRATPGSPQQQRRAAQVSTYNLLIASTQSEIASVSPGLDAQQGQRILTALSPTEPSSPRPMIDLALGILVGLFLGTLLAFVRDRMDEKLRGRAHLGDVVDAPVLAVVPHANVPRKRAWVATVDEPRGPAAEAYRTLRTNVLANAARHDMRLIAVTSPMPGEGKSTTSANLAVALAQTGKRTLLVSGDLRAPRLSKLLGVENTWGLVDVLRRGAALQEVAQTAYDDRLKILNSGPLPASPVELLQSPRLHEFLLEQRAAFDFVIVDCSPVLGLADALAVAPVVDGIILVASGTSKQGAIAEARAELDQVGGRVVGSVLNDIPVKRLRTKAYGYGATAYRYTASDSDETRVVGASGNGNGNGEPVAAGRRSRSKE